MNPGSTNVCASSRARSSGTGAPSMRRIWPPRCESVPSTKPRGVRMQPWISPAIEAPSCFLESRANQVESTIDRVARRLDEPRTDRRREPALQALPDAAGDHERQTAVRIERKDDAVDRSRGIVQPFRRPGIGRFRVEDEWRERCIGMLPGALAPCEQRFARIARDGPDCVHQRTRWAAAVACKLRLAHCTHTQPGAAAFIANRITPATNRDVLAVVAQRLADAAGARGNDGARPAAVRAQERRIPVVRELDLAEAIRHLHEISVVFRDDRAGQAQSDRAFCGLPGVNVRGVERAFDGLRDILPRLLHALSERRWPRLREAQYFAVGLRQPGASSCPAAVDADNVTNDRVIRRHAGESAACSMISSRYHLPQWYAIGLHPRAHLERAIPRFLNGPASATCRTLVWPRWRAALSSSWPDGDR